MLTTNRVTLVKIIEEFRARKQPHEQLVAPRPLAGMTAYQRYVAFVKVSQGGRNLAFLETKKGMQEITKERFDSEWEHVLHAWRVE